MRHQIQVWERLLDEDFDLFILDEYILMENDWVKHRELPMPTFEEFTDFYEVELKRIFVDLTRRYERIAHKKIPDESSLFRIVERTLSWQEPFFWVSVASINRVTLPTYDNCTRHRIPLT